ncbi:hypothetical protein BD414DRAFT_531811 [Trametes punicea]|nr:hypothetical protein BD414DRAFT_531811 [Trametes punicea]
MLDLAFNIYGAVAATVSLLALIPTVVYWFLRRLPSARFKVLETTFKDMEAMFQEGLEQGLLHGEDQLHRLHARFWTIRLRFDDLQGEVYEIRTWTDELWGWYKGLSAMMSFLHNDVQQLRGTIAKSSSRERRALMAAGFASRLAAQSSKRDRFFSYVGTSPIVCSSPVSTADLFCPGPPSSAPKRRSASEMSLDARPSTSEPPAYDSATQPSSQATCHNIDDGDATTLPLALSTVLQTCSSCGIAIQAQQYLAWDAELIEMLSLASRRDCQGQTDGAKRQRQIRKELLCRFSMQLLGLDDACISDEMQPENRRENRPAERTRSKAGSGRSRRGYRAHVEGHGATAHGDRRAKSHSAGIVGCDEDEWYEVP